MFPSCKDICDNATNYLEGHTAFPQRLALRFHLLICRHCRRFLRQFKLMVGMMAAEPMPSPSDEEIDRLVARLANAGISSGDQ